MKFRTEYEAKKSCLTLNPSKPVALVGSCFSQNITRKMQSALWESVNPLGTLFNPASINKAVRMALLSNFADNDFEKSLFLADGVYRSWFFDSGFASSMAPTCNARFRNSREELFSAIARGRTLIITLGTAWIYQLAENPNCIVGNCHKQPASKFVRRRLGLGEIVEILSSLVTDLQHRFPGLQTIFTVSPVRHLKDGFDGNSRSKALLLIAVEEVISNLADCHYFPAFEILNDDLRDYRFYESDLVHPSAEAIEYIWEKFCETFLTPDDINQLKTNEKLHRRSLHRPIIT